ncbi:DgyrCDS12176 [Dimorphilus gyrociliatus]|uniref:DgyrCDS12176 n=1 Tax=Dimorphilus gyrociliatus TaxID=2664684 RepID=A0A7I8W5M5_9ANNE|nr:DgyrCDS12176 [Dimorphilus gyrociliatus]
MAPSMLVWRSRGLQAISQTNPIRAYASTSCPNQNIKSSSTDDKPVEANEKGFVDIENPYKKEPQRCIICKHNIELDYKNARLLSQFISPYTGGIYNRSVTGLCIYMQKRIAKLIRMSRRAGYMGYTMKNPDFLSDPKLFDHFKRK